MNSSKLLITADWHIRGERPRCRTDESWIEAQRKDVAFLVDKAIQEDAILCIVGDIFHTPRTATEAVNMIISELKRLPEGRLFILAGNHDLPYHSYDHLEQSSIGTLLKYFPELTTEAGRWDAYPFGMDEEGSAPIRFVHRLVFPDQTDLAKLAGADTAETIAEEFRDNQLIVCGDYHHAFAVPIEEKHQMVLNPGCLNIQAADMIGYQPKAILVEMFTDYSDFTYDWVEIPQPKEVVTTDEYLEADKERDERLEAFMDTVSASGEVSLSFRDNLEKRVENVRPEVKHIVTSIIQEVSNESK